MASRAGATVDGHCRSYNFEQWVNGDGGSDSESHDDDDSEVLAKDKEHMKAIANRVPKGPCDCNRGMCVWPSTVGPKPNERRSKGRAARNFANDHKGLGQWTGVWKSQWAHVPGPQGLLRCVGETHVKCLLVRKAEPLPMCAS